MNGGRLGLSFWGDNSLDITSLSLNDTMNVVHDYVDAYKHLDCSEPKLGNVLNYKKGKESVSSVTFVTMAGELTDQRESILRGRSQSDNVIVLSNLDIKSPIYEV